MLNKNEFSAILELWNSSKPILKEAFSILGKKITIVIHGGSFPSIEDQDIGIGSPYSDGARKLFGFFEPIVDAVQLGPWGKTYSSESSYNTHSPYTSLLESLNPFFIDFHSLTTISGGNLLSTESFENAVKNRPVAIKNRIEFEYVEKTVNEFMCEIYESFLRNLNENDQFAEVLKKELDEFEKENRGIFLDAIYHVLVDKYTTEDFTKWEACDSKLPLMLDRNNKRAERRLHILKKENKTEIEKYLLAQLLAKKHINIRRNSMFKYIADKEVAIVGSDLWKLQDIILFEIDGKNITLGVGPDMYSQNGRNWGMKIFDYQKLFDENGNLTKGGKKLHKMFKSVFLQNPGGLRIDHFQGVIDPFVFIDNDGTNESGAGRLFSSPESKVLSKYAIREDDSKRRLEKYALFFQKIIFDAAKAAGLDENSIIPEDLGSITNETREVMDKFKLPEMCITQFVNFDDPNCRYNARNAKRKDLISSGTHDSPPLIDHISWMDKYCYSKLVDLLCENLKINDKSEFYSKEGRKTAIKAKFAELFVSKAQHVQIFFTHIFGMSEYYNKPGCKSVDKWRTRIPNDFERRYFYNMLKGTAFDPFDAIIRASRAMENEELGKLIPEIKERHEKLLSTCKEVLSNEHLIYSKETTNIYEMFNGSPDQLEIRNKIFKEDAKYRDSIAKAICEKPEKLGRIIGTEELTCILRNSSYENFCTDDIDKNTGFPQNMEFRINLHMHTTESDGKMSVEDLIKQQSEYGQKSNKIILFAISNHDSIDDAKMALEIISKNPDEYQNILFIPAVEINTKYSNKNLTRQNPGGEISIQLETIGYGINPFDEGLNKFFSNISAVNKETVMNIIDEYNKWGLGADLEEAKNSNVHLRYMGSSGVIGALKRYIMHKAISKGWIWKDHQHDAESIILNLITYKYGCENITPATPTYEEVIETISNSGFGVVGIAHPALIDLKNIKVSSEHAIKTIISDIIDRGARCIEINYQYPYQINESLRHWANFINEFCDLQFSSVLKTGGIDNHGNSIFVRNE